MVSSCGWSRSAPAGQRWFSYRIFNRGKSARLRTSGGMEPNERAECQKGLRRAGGEKFEAAGSDEGASATSGGSGASASAGSASGAGSTTAKMGSATGEAGGAAEADSGAPDPGAAGALAGGSVGAEAATGNGVAGTTASACAAAGVEPAGGEGGSGSNEPEAGASGDVSTGASRETMSSAGAACSTRAILPPVSTTPPPLAASSASRSGSPCGESMGSRTRIGRAGRRTGPPMKPRCPGASTFEEGCCNPAEYETDCSGGSTDGTGRSRVPTAPPPLAAGKVWICKGAVGAV